MKADRGDYRNLVVRVGERVRACVPEGAVVAVVSKGDDHLIRFESHRGWHFPRGEWGEYAGHHPATSAEALTHLRRLYGQGARYLLFPATSLWWLDHYRELAQHLEAEHRLLAKQDDVCLIYELRASVAFDAFSVEEDDAEEPVVDRRSSLRNGLLSVRAPVTPERPRILSILARYGAAQSAGAEETIATLFERQMPHVDRTTIIVDNALPRDLIKDDVHSMLLGGDNRAREFSAFDRAVEFAGSRIWSYDLVHFATSAFNTLYIAYLDRFDTDLLRTVAGEPVCLGHIDCYNEPVEVASFIAQHWVRSCFFFLAPADVMALGSFVSLPPDWPLFSGDCASPFRADAPLSAGYRRYITDWLTGHGLGQGVEWHSRFTLSREMLPGWHPEAYAAQAS